MPDGIALEVAAVADEAVTLIVSDKGWASAVLRLRAGSFPLAYKDGDGPGSTYECRLVDSLVIALTEGYAFTIPIAVSTSTRGMGAPLPSLFIEIGSGKIAHVLTGKPEDELLVAGTSGTASSVPTVTCSRQKAARSSWTLEDGCTILPTHALPAWTILPHCQMTAVCSFSRLTR